MNGIKENQSSRFFALAVKALIGQGREKKNKGEKNGHWRNSDFTTRIT